MIRKIYTVDGQLAIKIRDIKVENLISESAIRKYPHYMQKRVLGELEADLTIRR